mmetsp:Transcript_84177/g.132941  ORF Transcript_84177/g.132941 Transcript_84177/m.132941 type:complete len:179 (-) Transcript_84177:88-624(-)|eukprot:CAMPEP_0169077568 /NCGR_PEP_ID=MMETSP1015-20121227/8948_1 /TAXON_ID=342587 /ORGANISM="Karlodinium micrum, Strain CCMP2283" /LENGTH=178 /DNA_ID=CAMNT_0009137101 /DNA_START=63 /DNA_END=599 /DNA_ORIENTATION=-
MSTETCLGTAVFDGFVATLVDKGTRTEDIFMIARTTEGCKKTPAGTKTERMIAITGESSGRKATVETSPPADLMYMKETVSIVDKSTGNSVGSVQIANSADGVFDLWDGEEITIGLFEKAAVEPNQWKVVIQRTTKLLGDPAIDEAVIKGEPGALEAADAEEKRCTKDETWEALVSPK